MSIEDEKSKKLREIQERLSEIQGSSGKSPNAENKTKQPIKTTPITEKSNKIIRTMSS